jgi:hypothetical protein
MQLPTSAPDDILDILEPATLPVHEFPWVAVLAAAAALVMTALAVYWWRRRRRPAIGESLENAARRRLREVGGADPRTLHTELAEILTEYAEQRLGLRGSRLTSAEITREFRRNGVMSAAWQESLAGFLRECDRVKFAPLADSDFDVAARVRECRMLIEELAAAASAAPKLADPWKGWTNAAF